MTPYNPLKGTIVNKLWTAIRTNENGARTKALVATGITVAAVAAGIYLTKKNAPLPAVIVVEEVVEAVTDAPQS